ncbi:ABC transporter [Streptomyces sp. NPDC059010]|uniref:ABC transporter n=1 Tax=Streptomyces sp. NPDC059010 TaxID=3346695 RepID=UPI003686D46E
MRGVGRRLEAGGRLWGLVRGLRAGGARLRGAAWRLRVGAGASMGARSAGCARLWALVPPVCVQLWALIPPVWRGLPWRALAVAGGGGALLAGSARLTGPQPGVGEGLFLLRAAGLVGALGLAFLFDDPARHTTAATPVGRATRAGLRTALIVPVAALWWAALVLLIPDGARPPVGAVTLEAAAMAACAMASASAAVRFTRATEPGRDVAMRLAAMAGAVMLVPSPWGLLVGQDDLGWGAAQGRWAMVLGTAVVLGVCWTRESPRRRRVPRRSALGSYGV